MRERLKVQPAQEVIDYLLGPRLDEDSKKNFKPMMKVNKAHVVMLKERGIITGEVFSKIISALLEIEKAGVEEISLDPNLEELYLNIEDTVIKKIGPEVGGQMHTGRSRNDLYATTLRMQVRQTINSISTILLSFIDVLLEKGKEHCNTVMTGYTHLQPAQPITLGHYFSAMANALERDYLRVERAYASTNLNPLGAGALAATGFNIDRLRTTELLGFDGLIENSLDAVASRDYIIETLAGFAILTTNLSRLATDLHIWYTNEFSMIDIADDVAGTSSIMPQKKNPSAIEHSKSKAAHVLGILVSAITCLKNTPFSHSREVGGESSHFFDEAAWQTESNLKLLHASMRGLRANKDLMISRASQNFCTMTELTDTLVRNSGLSFREAHGVVGSLVKEAIDKGIKNSSSITTTMLKDAIRKEIGKELNIEEEVVRKALDPAENVLGKVVLGGPAPSEVMRMVREGEDRLKEDVGRLQERSQKLLRADEVLESAVTKNLYF